MLSCRLGQSFGLASFESTLRLKAVSEGGGGWLVYDAWVVETHDGAGVLGGLALGSM